MMLHATLTVLGLGQSNLLHMSLPLCKEMYAYILYISFIIFGINLLLLPFSKILFYSPFNVYSAYGPKWSDTNDEINDRLIV